MKPRSVWWLAPFLLACGGSLFTVEIERSSEAVIAKGNILDVLLGDLGFGELSDLDITTSEEIQNAGAEPGDIDGVFVQRMSLSVVDPPGADLAFIDRIDVFVEAPDLARVLIASSDAFGDGVTAVDLELEGLDLTEYAVSTSMTVSLSATGRRPSVDTRLLAEIVLDVGVTREGACKAARS